MKKILTAAAALAALSGCEVSDFAGERFSNEIMHVRYDEGGSIQRYEQNIKWANEHNRTILIDGPCMSACTMYLGADHVYVTPRADFKFHGAIPTAPGETRANQNEIMARHYPKPLRDWFYGEGINRYFMVFEEIELERVMALTGVEFWKGE